MFMKVVKVTNTGNLVIGNPIVEKTMKVNGKDVKYKVRGGNLGFLMIDGNALGLKKGDELPAELASRVRITDEPVLDATTKQPLGGLKWATIV
jgi:hypothetical protein